jgi:hypothetical protein
MIPIAKTIFRFTCHYQIFLVRRLLFTRWHRGFK